MQEKIIELVVYRIRPEAREAYVTEALDRFRRLVMGFDGFVRYDVFGGCHDENKFMDFVVWETLEHAEAAAAAVKVAQKAPEYAQYVAAFEKLEIFSHFRQLKSWN